MKRLLLVLLVVSSLSYGQGISKFSTDSIEVLDKSGEVKNFSCNCDFAYTEYQFIMNCSDIRVNSFLLPGSSFMDLGFLVFYDTGYTVNMNDSTTVNSDTTKIKDIGVIYQTYEIGTKHQFIQKVDSSGVMLLKRDKTYIKFK